MILKIFDAEFKSFRIDAVLAFCFCSGQENVRRVNNPSVAIDQFLAFRSLIWREWLVGAATPSTRFPGQPYIYTIMNFASSVPFLFTSSKKNPPVHTRDFSCRTAYFENSLRSSRSSSFTFRSSSVKSWVKFVFDWRNVNLSSSFPDPNTLSASSLSSSLISFAIRNVIRRRTSSATFSRSAIFWAPEDPGGQGPLECFAAATVG